MKAIKHILLVLAGIVLLALPTQVTAYELSINFSDKVLGFYVMPSEEAPKEDMKVICSPGWTWDLYKWELQDDGSYSSVLSESGPCSADKLPTPYNPFDRFGV